MTTDEFIDFLEQRQLVPSNIARQLRTKSEQGDSRITPKSILKYLVKKELVTRSQAKELLETTLVVSEKAESSILGLVPLADVEPAPKERVSRREPDPPAAIEKPLPPVKSRSMRQQPIEEEDLFSPAETRPEDVDIEGIDAPSPAFVSDAPAPGSKLRVEKKKPKKSGGKKPKQTLKPSESQWDSPLLLLGGGGLVVLVLASVVLYWLLFRESADAVLKTANENYERGAYQQAIDHYNHFLEKFSSHEAASDVRVRVRMAELWDAVEGRKDFASAARMAPEILTDIEDEPAFISNAADPEGVSEAKEETSTLLARIAQGLAKQAEESDDDETVSDRVKLIQTVLELSSNAKYVPPRLRLDSDLDAVRATLDRVQTRERREADLAAALKSMDEAIANGEPAAALAARADLLKNHPVLADDATLAAKVLEISAAEKAAVKFVAATAGSAAAAPPESPVVAELALAERRGESAPASGKADGTAVVLVDGALYGLNAADGALLWRRYVGQQASATPLVLDGGRVVVSDGRSGEVVLLESGSGKPVWRLPLNDKLDDKPAKLASPVSAGSRLLVASESGKLYVIDANAGKLIGHIEFGQPLRVPPSVNDSGDRAYVVGDHSSLYALSTDNFSCVGVYYLGHAAGGVATAPLAVLNKIVVADNSGAETCRLRVLAVDERGAPQGEVASQRLSGLVLTPLMRAGRRLATVTSLGQAVVFEIGAANDKTALTPIASRDAQDAEPMARFGLIHNGHLWMASRQLMKLEILPTGNQLPVRSLERNFQADSFDYPLQAVGDLVIHLRRPTGRAGAIVGAMDATANKTLWETELAVPPAGPPAIDPRGGRISTGVASGAVYLLEREAMARRVQDRAERAEAMPGEPATYSSALDLGQGRIVLGSSEGKALLHFRPGDPRDALQPIELPGPLACSPIAWGNAFVAATSVGQVFLYDSDSASQLAAPFQPELTPGRKFAWIGPAVVGDGETSLLALSDGVAKIYLLKRQAQPQPNLAAVATADVGASPLVTPLAVSGDRIYAGTENGKLASFAATDLAAGEPTPLDSRIDWGPFAVEGGLLAATESGELILIGPDGAPKWRRAIEHGELGGTPLAEGGQAFVLQISGRVSRINLVDGTEAGFLDLGQPAVAGPVAFDKRLVLAGADGTLIVINRP